MIFWFPFILMHLNKISADLNTSFLISFTTYLDHQLVNIDSILYFFAPPWVSFTIPKVALNKIKIGLSLNYHRKYISNSAISHVYNTTLYSDFVLFLMVTCYMAFFMRTWKLYSRKLQSWAWWYNPVIPALWMPEVKDPQV